MEDVLNIAVQETFARMLATENVNIRYSAKARTASFEVKTRLLMLPMYARLMEIVYDLLAAHEVAHALWTPCSRMQAVQALRKSLETFGTPKALRFAVQIPIVRTLSVRAARYLNVGEDVRIEALMKERYSGLRLVFARGYAILLKNGFFGKLDNLSKKSLIDRINLHFKCGHVLKVPFADVEHPYVDAVGRARTFGEMVVAIRDVFLIAHDTADQELEGLDDEQEPESSPEPGDEDDSEDDDGCNEGDEPASGNGDDEDSEPGRDSEPGSSGDEDSEPGSGDDKDSEPGSSGDEGDKPAADKPAAGDGDGDDEDSGSNDKGDKSEDGDVSDPNRGKQNNTKSRRSLDCETQENFDRALQQCQSSSDSADPKYTDIPRVNPKYKIMPWTKLYSEMKTGFGKKPPSALKTEKFQAFIRSIKPDVLFLYQQFEMRKRADEQSRTFTSTMGDVNHARLWSYLTDDDIFLAQETISEGQNHGLVIVCDWSGSMSGPAFDVFRQLVILMDFCRLARIPFEVYNFQDTHSNIEERFLETFLYQNETLKFQSVHVSNLFSSRMNQIEYYQQCLMFFSSFDSNLFNPPVPYLKIGGGTPLVESMTVMSELLPAWRLLHNLQIVHCVYLTDGTGNGWTHSGLMIDPITRRTYKPTDGDGENLSGLDIMPQVFRDRTGANLIGWFVGGPSQCYPFNKLDNDMKAKMLAELEENRYAVCPCKGYNEFYLMNPSLSTKDPADLTDRIKTRVMLGRFIKLISA